MHLAPEQLLTSPTRDDSELVEAALHFHRLHGSRISRDNISFAESSPTYARTPFRGRPVAYIAIHKMPALPAGGSASTTGD